MLLCALACTGSSDSVQHGPAIRDSAGVRIVENRAATWTTPWQVAAEPSLVIGAEDDAGRALYQVTGALRVAGGRIVIANAGTYELRFYNEAGEFVNSSGRRGSGPGEFLSLEMISRYGPDSLLVVDAWSHRVSYFDTDGSFGRSVRLEPSAEISLPRALGVFDDGSLLATKGLFLLGGRLPARTEREDQPLFRYEPDGQEMQSVGSFPGVERAVFETGRVTPAGGPDVVRMARRFGRGTAYATAGNRFYVADNASYEIGVYSKAGRLTHLFRRAYSPLPVTEADLRALRDSVLANERDPISLRSWEHRPPPPETMPAYAPEIHVDAERNLWVREYARPGDRNWTYSVFTEDGIFLGTLPVPAGLAVLDIGRDYLLGLRRDQLGVEYVQLHELRKER